MYKVVRVLLVLAILSPMVLFASEPEHGHKKQAEVTTEKLTPQQLKEKNTEYYWNVNIMVSHYRLSYGMKDSTSFFPQNLNMVTQWQNLTANTIN